MTVVLPPAWSRPDPRTRRPRLGLFLLALDTVVILLPVSGVVMLGGVLIVIGGIASLGIVRDLEVALIVLATLLSWLAMGALWHLVVGELAASPEDAENDVFCRGSVHLGALIVLLAWCVPGLGLFAAGTPLLVPYAHVLVHRALRRRAAAQDRHVEPRGQP